MPIQIIRLRSALTAEELMQTARERVPQFKAIPGLLQKYYFKSGKPGEYGGIYIWDSDASLEAFRTSDLAASIPGAYQVKEAPDIEMLELVYQLRP